MPDVEPQRVVVELAYPDAELVFGLVYPVGTDYTAVQLALENYLKRFNYKPNSIKLSDYIRETLKRVDVGVSLDESSEASRLNSYMTAGNRLCEKARDESFLVAGAVANINRQRKLTNTRPLQEPIARTAHLFFSLKRPQEVELLRAVYGAGFFLIGVFASENDRLRYLTRDKNIPPKEARRIMRRDEDEDDDYGQRSRRTFELADVFVHLHGEDYKYQLERFLDLVFGHPYHTPEPDEHAMFMAYSASLRSGQLARQVGAAIRSAEGEIIAVGCNDVPAAGGGLYWPNSENPNSPRYKQDQRDHIRGFDSNDFEQAEILEDLLNRFGIKVSRQEALLRAQNSRLMDITEYGRSVHAEMDALLTCARSGISPRGGTVFTTTFPCHNCTRHIIASGVTRVVYIEPYPKSMASKLHKDAIELTGKTKSSRPDGRFRIPFEPFVGIGPRRFFDLFSMKLSSGYVIKRKTEEGHTVSWRRDRAVPRVQMLPTSYTQREKVAAAKFLSTVEDLEEKQRGIQRISFPKQH